MLQIKVIVSRLNKRKGPITDFTDKSNIAGVVSKGFTFQSDNEITNDLGKWYIDSDGYYYWGGGVNIIISDDILPDKVTKLQSGKADIPLPKKPPQNLPLTKSQCLQTANWLNTHFGKRCEAAVENTPFTKELLYAIACKESAYKWMHWIDNYDANTILGRCVFDASGEPEFPDKPRNVSPRNRDEFKAHFGVDLLNMLVEEGNKQRIMPQPDAPHGYHPAPYLYKGYGIFQYDLQFILTGDANFFTQKLWYNIDDCIDRVMKELNDKWKKYPNNLFETIRAYNGRGDNAINYANSVLQFLDWINNKT